MDVLSEVLRVVKLQGALFYNGEFSSPWSVFAAPSCELARYFGTDTEHVMVYHLLSEGQASVRLDDGKRLNLEAGDIVMTMSPASRFKRLPSRSEEHTPELQS